MRGVDAIRLHRWRSLANVCADARSLRCEVIARDRAARFHVRDRRHANLGLGAAAGACQRRDQRAALAQHLAQQRRGISHYPSKVKRLAVARSLA